MSNSLFNIYYISASKDINARANICDDVISNPDIPISVILKRVISPFDLSLQISDIDTPPGRAKIIFDYLSFTEKTSINKYCQVVRDVIISYPEYDFYFDVQPDKNTTSISLIDFLFDRSGIGEERKIEIISHINISLHEFNSRVRSQLHAYHKIVLGQSNIFDASNLRWALMEINYARQGQIGRNYQIIQNQRCSRLAACVHSDRETAILNCYLLFANGYRVLPVSSTFELNRSHNDPELIIRDLNLLFANEDRVSGSKAKKLILGFIQNENGLQLSKSEYWNWGKKYYFLSCDIEPIKDKAGNVETKENNVIIPGTKSSTVNGIYVTLEKILQNADIPEKPLNLERNDDTALNKSIDTLEMINSMVMRADRYYEQKCFVFSALVSRAALELNNGFFPTLSAKSIYTLALAENAIASNNMLGDDLLIAEDAEIRVKYIKREVTRLIKNGSNNLINQIFSDCRLHCKEKEHFESEDVFLAAMAELNEGISFKLPDKIDGLLTYFKLLLAYLKGTVKKHKDFIYEQKRQFFEKVNSYGSESRKEDGTNNRKGNGENGEKEG